MSWRLRSFWIVLLLLAGVALWLLWGRRLEHKFDPVIAAAARKYDVNPALVKAIVWRESRFNESARGRAQEIGLMQLREEAAQEWADAEHIERFEHEHCLDPATNTMAGTFYLAKLMKRYTSSDNPVPYALADYNAGRGNVLKWLAGEAATNSAAFIAGIGFPDTRDYVKTVIARSSHYQFSAGNPAPRRVTSAPAPAPGSPP